MNTKTIALYAALLMMLVTWNGCLDEKVKTIIHPDGSAERFIRLTASGPPLPEGANPVPGDSGWQVVWNDTSKDAGDYKYTAHKIFRSPDELMREYDGHANAGEIGITVLIKKRFEWFFTYMTYQEKYLYHNPYHNLPITDFLSLDELARFQHGEKNDTIKDKVEQWKKRDQMEELFHGLVAEAQRRNDPALPPSLLAEHKNEIMYRLLSSDSAEHGQQRKADSLKKGAGKKPFPDKQKVQFPNGVNEDSLFSEVGADSTVAMLRPLLGSEAIFSFRPAIVKIWADILAKEKKLLHPDTWHYSVEMPGLLVGANGDKIEGNTVSWDFNPDQVRVAEYLMEASSRVTNVWAFIVTGLLAVVAVVLAIRRR